MLKIEKVGHAGCYYFYNINGTIYGTTQTQGNEWTFEKQEVSHDDFFGTCYRNTGEKITIKIN